MQILKVGKDLSSYEITVNEYLETEKALMKNFLNGICRLGRILYKARDDMKKKGLWMDFCKDIGISVSKANAQIRIFQALEMDGDLDKSIIELGVTNWKKMQIFLSLPKDARKKVEEKIASGEIQKETTNDDFIQTSQDILGVPEPLDLGQPTVKLDGEVTQVENVSVAVDLLDLISDISKARPKNTSEIFQVSDDAYNVPTGALVDLVERKIGTNSGVKTKDVLHGLIDAQKNIEKIRRATEDKNAYKKLSQVQRDFLRQSLYDLYIDAHRLYQQF